MWEMNGTEIAIIGMSGRFPGAASVEELWQMLRDGRDCFIPLSEEESLALGTDPRFLQMPEFKRVKCTMDDVDQFDYRFFDLEKDLADVMDPQQRVFLECCWEAFEMAGYNPSNDDSVVGTFAAADQSSYLIFNLLPKMEQLMGKMPIDEVETLNSNDFVASRVAYHLNLTGPSYTIKCGCSSALVAVHNACNALIEEECDMALAGGISILVHKLGGYLAEEKGFTSKSGRMQPFDKDANGFIRGAGGGVVLLKRLEDALAEGDNVLAVIRGSAVTNDGGDKAGFGLSSVSGIASAAIEGLAVSGAHASSLQYVEGMGLSWPTDDHIEVRALSHAFRADGALENQFCLLGSAKGNVGHLSAASGIASLIKATCVVKHAEIPKIANLENPDPKIDFAATPFVPVLENQPWPACNGPRRAGVNIRGAGGTNVFMVLEQAPPHEWPVNQAEGFFFPISAKSPEALAQIRRNLAAALRGADQKVHPADVAYTLQIGRKPFQQRMGWVARNLDELIEGLENDAAPLAFWGHHQIGEAVDPVFFYGELEEASLQACLEFILDRAICLSMFENVWVRSRWNQNFTGEAFLNQIKQHGIGSLSQEERAIAYLLGSYVVTEWWRFRGVTPRAVAGRGLGDLVAAAVAGAAPLEHIVAVLRACVQGPAASLDLFGINPRGRLKVSDITWYSGLVGGEIDYNGLPKVEYIKRVHDGEDRFDAAMAEIGRAGFMYVFDVVESGCIKQPVAALTAADDRQEFAPFSPLALLRQVAELWLAGVDINWQQFYGEAHPRRVSLPSYPFERERCWI